MKRSPTNHAAATAAKQYPLSAILSASFPEESLCILSFLQRKSKDRAQEKAAGPPCARQ
jgi:hypothetical protein